MYPTGKGSQRVLIIFHARTLLFYHIMPQNFLTTKIVGCEIFHRSHACCFYRHTTRRGQNGKRKRPRKRRSCWSRTAKCPSYWTQLSSASCSSQPAARDSPAVVSPAPPLLRLLRQLSVWRLGARGTLPRASGFCRDRGRQASE